MDFRSAQLLLKNAEEKELYTNLIQQLNKDLIRANTELQFAATTKPEYLIETLRIFIKDLMLKRFPDYLNLLYVIDVSERTLKKMNDTPPELIIDTVVLLILKREWQKVYYKSIRKN